MDIDNYIKKGQKIPEPDAKFPNEDSFGEANKTVFEIAPGRKIGYGQPVFVMAEGGNNHQGELEIAKRMVDLAVLCGADCVKFQKRTTKLVLTKELLNRPYTGPQSFGPTYGAHRDALELSKDEFRDLANYCQQKKIIFTASGWDEESVDFLDEIGVPFFKMASADLTNFPLLEHTAKKGKPVVISTGMSDLETVKKAYELLRKHTDKVVILQCTSTYPAEAHDINLNVIHTFQREFPQAVVGYSGHENGVAISSAAVVMGAKLIERHFTLNRSWPGSDHAASLEQDGLRKLIRDIRAIEKARGNSTKRRLPAEEVCFEKLSKSIVWNGNLPSGTVVKREHLLMKGPGRGISPMLVDKVIGKKLKTQVEDDTIASWDQME